MVKFFIGEKTGVPGENHHLPQIIDKLDHLYNNNTINAIVNAASNISSMPLIQADVFVVLLMNELKNFTIVVIGKLGKLVHKQNYSIVLMISSIFLFIL
jgi:hypothetical protein